MNDAGSSGTAYRVLVAMAMIVVVVAGMRAASAIVVPFLLAIFLAILCTPPLTWLSQRRIPGTGRKIPRAAAMLIVLAAIPTLAFWLGTLFYDGANRLLNELPEIVAAKIDDGMKPSDEEVKPFDEEADSEPNWFGQFLARIGVEPDQFDELLPDRFKGLLSEWTSPGYLITFSSLLLQTVGTLLSNAFLILLTTVFLLMEATAFPDKIRVIAPDPDRQVAELQRVATEINRYMGIKTWISFLTGLFITISLTLIGVREPVLWGILAFLLNYVPNIGSIIAAVPPVLLTLVDLGPGTAIFVAAIFLAVNMIVGSYLEPRWMGKGLGLSTLVVFISLVFWGWVLGPVGMVISVPLTMTVKIALEANDDTRWMATLMGGDVSPQVATAR